VLPVALTPPPVLLVPVAPVPVPPLVDPVAPAPVVVSAQCPSMATQVPLKALQVYPEEQGASNPHVFPQ